jgi:predicted pyridoxine 5'-phosphate oxidase superfamily flavin-nucleotide-binding protein
MLAIPDRPGNNRLDTFENLLTHPDVGLFFMIPGNGDTLRISGKGKIVRDAALQGRLAVNGKAPNLILVATVEEAFMHCPKCMARSVYGTQRAGRIGPMSHRSQRRSWRTQHLRKQSPRCRPSLTMA